MLAVDAYEFSALKYENITAAQLTGDTGITDNSAVEFRPMFHEWATVQPGMICVARKKKTAVFRQYMAAETAVPVIACAACLPKEDEVNYYFAGIARSKSVRTPDDGIGPTVDEFFTVSIGGLATLLNTSSGPIYPGTMNQNETNTHCCRVVLTSFFYASRRPRRVVLRRRRHRPFEAL